MATVADSLARSVFLNLLDGCLERHHIVKLATVFVANRHAINTYAQTNHIILIISESRDAGSVQKMTHDFVWERQNNLVAHLLELLNLMHHEILFLRHVARRKMRENTLNPDFWIGFYAFDKLIDIFRQEAKAMHASVHFYMDANRLCQLSIQLIYSVFQLREATEAVNVRLQTIFDDDVEGVCLRSHHHDWQFDAFITQFDTFVGIRNSKIINMMERQSTRNLIVAASVCEGFHHHHHLGVFLKLSAIIVEVFNHVVEVDFENSLMRLLLQHLHDALKLEVTCSFQQNYLILKHFHRMICKKIRC